MILTARFLGKTRGVDDQVVIQGIGPVPIKVIADVAGTLEITFADQGARQVGVDPLPLCPVFNALFKRCGNPYAENPFNARQQILTGAAVKDDVVIQGACSRTNQVYPVDIELALTINFFQKCRRFFITLPHRFLGQAIVGSNLKNSSTVDQFVFQFLRELLCDRTAAAAHFSGNGNDCHVFLISVFW